MAATSSRPDSGALQHDTQDLFRLLVQSAVDYAIFLITPDGRIATWNPGAERIKGYRAEEIVGRPYATFFTDDRAAGPSAARLSRL